MNTQQIFDQFFANVNGQRVEISDSTNTFQCMDLAYAYVFCLGFPKATIQRLYAKDVYLQASDLTRQYFDVIQDSLSGMPQKGDIVVFNNKNSNGTAFNVAGHIAICIDATLSSFRSLDQNWNAGQFSTTITHNYNTPYVLGWLRPKISGGDDSQCQIDLSAARAEIVYKNTQITSLQDQVNGFDAAKTRFKSDLKNYVDSYSI